MTFNTLFMAHVVDADPKKHHTIITTPKYILHTLLVENPTQGIELISQFTEKNEIDSIILCPGFTNMHIADIQRAVGENVSVNVARGDGPGQAHAFQAMRDAGILR